VTRIGVEALSVTVATASYTAVLGCIESVGPRDENRRWCGSSYGKVTAGRLADPRLDVLCLTAAGDPIGSAWVQPAPAARYVVVMQAGYTEAYTVAGGLPVRVASARDVDVRRSRATFAISEHDRDGRLLRAYRLEAFVAG
jgi:hypothetical protein